MGGGFFNLRCNEGSITLIQGFHHPSHFLFWGFIWEGGMLTGACAAVGVCCGFFHPSHINLLLFGVCCGFSHPSHIIILLFVYVNICYKIV